MQSPEMQDLNSLGLFEKLKEHLVKAHSLTTVEIAAILPLANTITNQLLFDTFSEEIRYFLRCH